MPCLDAFLKIDVAEPVVLGGCISCHNGHSGLFGHQWMWPHLGKGGFFKLKKKIIEVYAGHVRDAALIPGLGRCPGVGHGNPLQYSCLENPMDRGACWDTVHGVTKSRTQLKRLSTHAHIIDLQYCVNFRYSQVIVYIYIYIYIYIYNLFIYLFQIIFPCRLLQNTVILCTVQEILGKRVFADVMIKDL